MSIVGSDPLAFLTAQGGVVGTPLTESGASGAEDLDVEQRSAVIGEPIPIVFCRRINNVGGVLISPPATECRYTNNALNDVTVSYHLVLSEGQIGSIEVRDVFQGACRVGSYTQTYNRRAGTFVPGNFMQTIDIALVQFSFDAFNAPIQTWYNARVENNYWRYYFPVGSDVEKFFGDNFGDVKQTRNTDGLDLVPPEVTTYCGTGGTYAGLSTMAFTVTIPAGFDQWSKQVHCFIRGGIYVLRLLDNVTGPSNNVADLLLYLLRNSSRVPEEMIDTASLLAAATFTNVNGFWFNGVISESTNLRDWMGSTLQYFLLRQARIGGKEALKPLVQTNANGTIKTTAVTWTFTFTEEHIIPESFDIVYTPLADRKPFCAIMLWRQQDDLGIPVMRTTEVRYTGTAVDGPFEQHDLSDFCSSENHAVKVGAYILSKRKHVTHRLQLGVKPDTFNATLAAGDLVRVRLERIASTGANSLHDYLYEVDRIGKSLSGEVQLDLTHFPVDADKVSLVAQEVNAAVGSGLTIDTGASEITCDINSFNDTSVPAEFFSGGTIPNYGTGLDELDEAGLDDPSAGGGGGGDELTGPNIQGTPEPGNTLTYDPCPDAYIEWRLIDNTTGEISVVSQGVAATYIPDSGANNKTVIGVGKCPDPSSPTGYGPEISSPPLLITDGFIPPPNPGATIGWILTSQTWSGGRNLCGSNAFYDSGLLASSVSSGTYSNIVGYKVLDQYSTAIYNCGGANGGGIPKNIGVMLKQANGTEILVGSLKLDNNAANATGVYGKTRSYNIVELTYLGVPFFTAPQAEPPPWPEEG